MLFLVFLIGLVTGFFDSTVGAGGLFSVPSLIFLGLPPQTAIATDRFGTVGQSLAAGYRYWKEKKIVWRHVPVFAILSLIGSVIGAKLLIEVDTTTLQKIVGVLVLVLLSILLTNQELGTKRKTTNETKRIIGYILYFLMAIFGGFFGQGTGPIVMFILTYFIGLTIIEVLATNVIPWLVLSISSTIIFGLSRLIDYKVGIFLMAGMSIGGYVGAKTAVKKGDLWIKRLFTIFVVVASIKLLFFLAKAKLRSHAKSLSQVFQIILVNFILKT